MTDRDILACQLIVLKNLDCVKKLKCSDHNCIVYYFSNDYKSEESFLDTVKNFFMNGFEYSLKSALELIHQHCIGCECKLCPDQCVYHSSLLLRLKMKWKCDNVEHENEGGIQCLGINANSFFKENFEFIENLRDQLCYFCGNSHMYEFSTMSAPEHLFMNVNYDHFLIQSEVLKLMKLTPLEIKTNTLFSKLEKNFSYKLSGIVISSQNSYFCSTLNTCRTWDCEALNISNSSLYDFLICLMNHNKNNFPVQFVYSRLARGAFKISENGWAVIFSSFSESELNTMPCGKIQDSQICSCCNDAKKFNGWQCECGQQPNSTICSCGKILKKCQNCSFFSTSQTCPYCIPTEMTPYCIPKEMTPEPITSCPVCSTPYNINFRICSFCLNPNPEIFN